MAIATKRPLPPVPLPEPDYTVTLELSGPEARTIRALVGMVSGDVSDTARAYASSVYSALQAAGVTTSGQDMFDDDTDMRFASGSKARIEEAR